MWLRAALFLCSWLPFVVVVVAFDVCLLLNFISEYYFPVITV